MSWFGRDAYTLLASGIDFTATDETLDIEIEDGVVVERRSVLWLSAAAVVSVLTGSLGAQDKQRQDKKQQAKPTPVKDSFAAFLANIYPKARELVQSGGKGEEAYLLSVAAAMCTLTDPGGEIRKEMGAFTKKHRKKGERFPIATMQMRMRPGSRIPHHDHRNYNGVILGIEGEIRVRNFDILGKDAIPPEKKTFQIRETSDDLILPGRFSTLASRRENVHDLVAGKEGGRVLDVFTFLKRGSRSVFLKVDAKPRDAEKRIWDAAWR